MNSNNRRVVNGINTVVIHNRDYVEVAERVRVTHELKKEFEVIESQPYQVADRWVWRAVILIDGKKYVGNAEIKLSNAVKGSPDSTNPMECAETSAVGRALSWAGLGTVDTIASYDEIARGLPTTTIVEAERLPAPQTPQDRHPDGQMSAHVSSSQSLKNGVQSQREAFSTEEEEKRARLNTLYEIARETGAIPADANKLRFLIWIGEKIGRKVEVTRLTEEDFQKIEEQVATKESEAAHA